MDFEGLRFRRKSNRHDAYLAKFKNKFPVKARKIIVKGYNPRERFTDETRRTIFMKTTDDAIEAREPVHRLKLIYLLAKADHNLTKVIPDSIITAWKKACIYGKSQSSYCRRRPDHDISSFVMSDFTEWDDVHGHYKILVPLSKNKVDYVVNPNLVDYIQSLYPRILTCFDDSLVL